MITANTKEIVEELKVLVSEFLQNRGLTLSEEKTIITDIDKCNRYNYQLSLISNSKLPLNPSPTILIYKSDCSKS